MILRSGLRFHTGLVDDGLCVTLFCVMPGLQEMNHRSVRHDMSPEIASKSLSALKDRKQEIISELKEIVGMLSNYI